MQVFDIPTDDTLRETRQHGNIVFPFQYYLDDINRFSGGSVPWHWHAEFEFVLVSQGTVLCFAGNHKYTLHQGEGLFINSGTIHRFESPDHGLMPNILFLPEFLAPKGSLIYNQYIKPLLIADFPCLFLSQEEPWQKQLLFEFNQLYNAAANEALSHREWELYTKTQNLWSTFFFHLEPSVLSQKVSSHNQLPQIRLQKMIEYIAQNYASRISLSQIASSASVSKSEALRCFQTVLHTTPVEYLIQYRLSQAVHMLTTSRSTITEIALACGFSSSSYFCRTFQKVYHQTPASFRQDAKK